MRLRAKVDDSQKDIVKAFRVLGWTVALTHQLGKGFPDTVISKRINGKGYTACVEIKDGAKPPSAQRLTPDELKWQQAWQGDYFVITSVQGVIDFNKHIMAQHD